MGALKLIDLVDQFSDKAAIYEELGYVHMREINRRILKK